MRSAGNFQARLPNPEAVEQHQWQDRGYDNQGSHEVVEQHGYVGHIRPVGEDRREPRRWVVERTIGWLNRCRANLVRYDKEAVNYLGLIQLGCSLFGYRRLPRLGAT